MADGNAAAACGREGGQSKNRSLSRAATGWEEGECSPTQSRDDWVGGGGVLANDVKAAEGCEGVCDDGIECLVCGKTFPSRSQLFKHLKKVGCGGEDSADVPRLHAEGTAQHASAQGPDDKAQRKATQKAKRPPPTISDAAVTLWFGDIPQELASAKRVGEILYSAKPHCMPTPYVKKVVKKGYRKGSSRDRSASQLPDTDAETATADSQVPTAGPSDEGRSRVEDDMKGHLGTKGSWLAYAFVVFRDGAEAEEAKAAFDGVQLAPGWIARVLPAAEPRKSAMCGEQAGAGAGEDPPLGLQLFPPCLRPLERAAAIARHQAAAGRGGTMKSRASSRGCTHGGELEDGGGLVQDGLARQADQVAEVKRHYKLFPRKHIAAQGVQVPQELLVPVLEELQRTRWPAVGQRGGMCAQHYLILYAGGRNEGFSTLYDLVMRLLAWADPVFPLTMIAVTKNFSGSPHVDACDTTFQYACSLGTFNAGGELCVEAPRGDAVYVVNTKDRIARVDGRFIHWVRGHGGGDRYSLVFYSTDQARQTPAVQAVHLDFRPWATRIEQEEEEKNGSTAAAAEALDRAVLA